MGNVPGNRKQVDEWLRKSTHAIALLSMHEENLVIGDEYVSWNDP